MVIENKDAVLTFKNYFEGGLPVGVDVRFDQTDGICSDKILTYTCLRGTCILQGHIKVADLEGCPTVIPIADIFAKVIREKLESMEAE